MVRSRDGISTARNINLGDGNYNSDAATVKSEVKHFERRCAGLAQRLLIVLLHSMVCLRS